MGYSANHTGRRKWISEITPSSRGLEDRKYKVEIHVGEQVNNISLVGAIRFTVAEQPPSGSELKIVLDSVNRPPFLL